MPSKWGDHCEIKNTDDKKTSDNSFPPTATLAIEGRVPTAWLLENMHKVSREDFYNQELTEENLKDKYGQ